MIKKSALLLAALMCLPELLFAQLYQGLQNNTAAVVRDPARQSSTEIDAVINNPAGTAFLKDGWNLSLNSKLATQTMDVYGYRDVVPNSAYDLIPSLQAAYKKDKIAVSLSLATEGGYGQWLSAKASDWSTSLTSFINNWQGLSDKLDYKDNEFLCNVHVGGSLYNFSNRIGVAWQINSHWAVYGGLRFNYVTEKSNTSIYQRVVDITGKPRRPQDFFSASSDLATTPDEIKIHNSTNDWGLAPIMGVDFLCGAFNFAIRYEPETSMHVEGGRKSYHLPGVISGGASWQIKENLKVAAGGSWLYQSKDSWHREEFERNDIDLFNLGLIGTLSWQNGVNAEGITNGYDCSASVTYKPLSRMSMSFGYTFAEREIDWKVIVSHNAASGYMSIVSAGLSIDMSDDVIFNFGISHGFPHAYMIGSYQGGVSNYQRTAISAGIDINIK